jgi:hypothetical protein
MPSQVALVKACMRWLSARASKCYDRSISFHAGALRMPRSLATFGDTSRPWWNYPYLPGDGCQVRALRGIEDEPLTLLTDLASHPHPVFAIIPRY